jgi:hypothetical protein
MALTSLGGTARAVGKIARIPQIAKHVPIANAIVAGIETVNAIHQGRQRNTTVTLGHAGNAAGCLAGFAEDVGLYVTLSGIAHGAVARTAIGLGFAGGVFGVVQGYQEIRLGRQQRAQTGATRAYHMGLADFVSGGTTLVGIALKGTGFAPTAGTAFLVGAVVCDMVSVGVDYLEGMVEKRRALESGMRALNEKPVTPEQASAEHAPSKQAPLLPRP